MKTRGNTSTPTLLLSQHHMCECVLRSKPFGEMKGLSVQCPKLRLVLERSTPSCLSFL